MSIAWENIPAELKDAPQWVVWRFEERDGKRTKPPFQPNGKHASHSDPATWNRFETVQAAYERGGWDGVGFVLSGTDPFAGVDLDHCIDPNTGEMATWARDVLGSLNSYSEISPSGTGARIFLRARLPEGAPKGGRKRQGLGAEGRGAIELYDGLRYLTVTGRRLGTVSAIEPRGEAFSALYHDHFDEIITAPKVLPVPAPIDLDDYELKLRMFQSQHGAEILSLWEGRTAAYPHPDGTGDHSAADLALCNHLAWWTGGDLERIDRMFRQSGLYRDKWERDDYRQNTIDLALSGMGEGYSPGLAFEAEEGAVYLNGHAKQPVPVAEDGLPAARELAATLPELLKDDKGAAYVPEMLRALGLLRALDPGAFERAKAAVKKVGGSLRTLERCLPPIGQYLRGRPAGTDSLPRVGDTLPDCPAPLLCIPKPFGIAPEGLSAPQLNDNEQPEQVLFAYAPILITARLRDVEEATESLRLAWKRPGLGWQERTVDRGAALDPRKLTDLASDGFPVAGDNAKQLARYLHRFEATNYNQLRCARVSSRLGWQGPDGDAGFLWGRTLLTPAGETTGALHLDETAPEDWQEDWISFRGLAAGDEQIADGYHGRGDLEQYIRAVTVLKDYPRVLLAFYAAFAPPLLQLLNAPNPILDWANRTSTGKTVTLRVAASVWGKPDERAPDGALGTWDSTRVWLERASYVLSALPLILDDTKRAKEPRMVADLLYTVASGRGRGRGNTKSLARVRTWRTVLLSSGEAPATSYTQDGGTRARVLEIRGVPFGKDDPATRQVVDALNLRLQTQYGTAGPEFIRWLYRNRHRWEEFAAEYQQCVEGYAARAESSVAGRMAHYAATIDMAAALAHAALPLPWSYKDPLEMLWAGIVDEASDASGEIRALRDVVSWAHANTNRFYGHHEIFVDGSIKEPAGGWLGAWEKGSGWEYIGFLQTELDGALRRFGYEPEAIRAGWKERGWLDVEGGAGGANRYTRKLTLADKRPRMVVLRREAIEEIDA